VNLMDSKPISIQNVQGNVTVTIIEGNNNKTELSIDGFTKRFAQDCGLRLIYNDYFKQDDNTSTNFNDWLNGFSFNIKSVYHEREYRRENLLKDIKIKLEEKQRLIILGESGTSKSVILMEVLCDYLKKGYKILHNLESGSIESSSSEIKNLEFIEDTLLELVESGEKILVVVDNVHNKTISNIFSIIKNIRDDNEDKLDKIRFLLSARQPEFMWAMDRGIFDSETINKINILFDEEKKFSISYFSEDEVKGFIEKYKENIHDSIKNKSIEENTLEIFKSTKGHPIMVRFSVLQNGLKSHVIQMYTDYLLENKSPNIERIKSVIACSLYDISSIPLTEDELYNKLNLEVPSLQISNTIIKRTENLWTTIHPRWDLELFKYLFSLNEADRRSIQKVFGLVFSKILEVQGETINQILILNTLYNTIAAEKFVNMKFIEEMIKVDDIEKKLNHPASKSIFFSNIIGFAFDILKDHENAIGFYDKAIEINPYYSTPYNNKGHALYALGRYEEAIVYFDKVIEIDPQDASAYNHKGTALSDLGRNEEAIVYFDKAIEINPQYTEAYYNKGFVLLDLGRNEEAIVCYNKVIEIDPQYQKAYLNKGSSLYALGRNEEAIVYFDKAIEINPQYADAYNNKGSVLLDLGRKAEAIVYFDKVIEINPQYADAYNNKGFSLYLLGRNEEAIVCYNKVIEIDPQYQKAYTNYGLALSILGRNEEAIVYFDKAIEIDPQDARAYLNKGIALSDLGRNEEAIVCYNKVIEINPQHTNAYNNKGIALSALGRYEEAMTWFNKTLAIDPNHSYALNGKAFALAILGRNEEALPIIEKVLEIDSNNENYLSTAAFVMYNLKNYEESKNYYNKALDVNPNLKDTLSESELKAYNSVME
jgi:tetratricopeptide (TPR) repeat protein